MRAAAQGGVRSRRRIHIVPVVSLSRER